MTPEELNKELDQAAMYLHNLTGCHIGIVALKDGNLTIKCTLPTFPETSGLFRATANHVDKIQFYGNKLEN